MSDDKRAPRARVEAGDRDDAVEADAHIIDDEADARKKASGASGGESFRDAGRAVSGWVSRTFPGHENAFWGGVAGLAIALFVFILVVGPAVDVKLIAMQAGVFGRRFAARSEVRVPRPGRVGYAYGTSRSAR